jgi:Fe-S cluster biosynthesis and repair protein YggX
VLRSPDFKRNDPKLAERIFQNISAEAWQAWLETSGLVMIVNEYQLNSADPKSIKTID